ncbi:MAG: DUF1015 domain-containing protein [Actinobacteria bacterium]|nr:DUF1015 domain-containing protein [Actinomycetota bacterium]
MVEIIPFKALRFNTLKNEEISNLVSPPYDIISPTQKENLKTFSENNIIRLILPEDNDNINKYESAKNILTSWIDNNILTIENEEALYIFEEGFLDNGEWKNFTAFIGLTKIEEYESSKILRHEYTLSKPKEDRLNLLKATNTNFGLIYTLYNDQNRKVQKILNKYKLEKPFYDFIPKYSHELRFKVWKIINITDINEIIQLMKDKNLLIADGHHRYETSRLFKHEIKAKREKDKNNFKKTFIKSTQSYIFPEDYVLTMYVNFNQENIKILPTHRLIKFEKNINLENIKKGLSNFFNIDNYCDLFNDKLNNELFNYKDKNSLKNFDLTERIKDKIILNISTFMKKSKEDSKKCFCFYSKGPDYSKDPDIFFCTLKKEINCIYTNLNENELEFEKLDVRILHKLIIENYLDKYKIKNIDYTHSLSDIVDKISIKTGEYDLGIILNAPEIKDVESLSLKGKVMPQKSTYFYPKPCSGLIMYKIDL